MSANNTKQVFKGRAFLGGFFAVLGALATLANYFPHLSVDTGTQLRADAPFSVPFEIANSNIFPIFDVTVSCRVISAKDRNDKKFTNWRSSKFRKPISIFWPGDQDHIACPSMLRSDIPLTHATIALTSYFRSIFWWPKHESNKCFQLRPTASGSSQWLPIICPSTQS